MGVTGGGLYSEEEIFEGSDMMNKWNEAKEWPEIYRLKGLLGERTNVSSHAINNSSQSLDLTSVLPGSSRRAARSGSEDEEDMDPEAAAEEMDNADVDMEVFSYSNIYKRSTTRCYTSMAARC